MEYEEVLVDGQLIKVATKVSDEHNPDYDLEDEEDDKMLEDTSDFSSLFDVTQEINIYKGQNNKDE